MAQSGNPRSHVRAGKTRGVRGSRHQKAPLGNTTRAMIVEGTKNYLRAVSQGVPGLPSAEGIKNFLEYDIKIPMQLKEDVPPERLLSLQLVEEVKKELETAQRRPSR